MTWSEAERLRPGDLDRRVLTRYAAHVRAQNLRPESVRSYLRSVNVWASWAESEGHLQGHARAVMPKAQREVIEVLTREEIDRMEAAATTPRDKLIVRVLADTGIRVSELVELRMSDLLVRDGLAYLLVRGKTGERLVGVSKQLHRRLARYAELGRSGDTGDDSRLFTPLVGSDPLTRSGVARRVREVGVLAGIRQTVGPHLLRHSYATWALRPVARGGLGMNPLMLERVLGHRSLAMIDRHYLHASADDLHAAMTGG